MWINADKPINSPKNGYSIPVEKLTQVYLRFGSHEEAVQKFGSVEKLLDYLSNKWNTDQAVAGRRVLQDADKGKTGAELDALIAEGVTATKEWEPGDREKGKGSQKDRAKQLDKLASIAASGRDEDREALAEAIRNGDMEAFKALLGQA